jgi:hypothetical protein
VHVLVDDWIRCALMPKSKGAVDDTHQSCVMWLGRYFELCDRSPNSNLTKVNADSKLDMHHQYKREMADLDPDMGLVDISVFVKLWDHVYPHAVNRSHCGIPGKCAICAEIDRRRQCAETRYELLQLRKAHIMHRGGMFMLERKRYV